jgi:hypothetical protein
MWNKTLREIVSDNKIVTVGVRKKVLLFKSFASQKKEENFLFH